MSDDAEEIESSIHFRNDDRITGFAEVIGETIEIGGMNTIDVARLSKHDAARLVGLIEAAWPDVRTPELTRLRKLIAILWHNMPPAERRDLHSSVEQECVAIAESVKE